MKVERRMNILYVRSGCGSPAALDRWRHFAVRKGGDGTP